ncbi:tol-pal system-associated acyl-CoA thioesterase [Flaviflagellibacter deserti]|uniref:Tol-pal system-associated acyl-CoA thioesterase n=1 Tax=Flaviflagellibacter deserti TaxID=2267266 RepID=A0ABV9YUF9_9HYPH
MSAHSLPIRIYWEDTDAGGVVYHASYLRFMERGRTELLRAAGVDQSEVLKETGLVFVVTRMEIDFRLPAKMDDEIVVETRIGALGGASLKLAQTISRGGVLLVQADVTCAAINRETGRPSRLPADVREKLAG